MNYPMFKVHIGKSVFDINPIVLYFEAYLEMEREASVFQTKNAFGKK